MSELNRKEFSGDDYKFVFPRENKETIVKRSIVIHPIFGLDRVIAQKNDVKSWSFDEIQSSTVQLYIDWMIAKLNNENDVTDTSVPIEDGLIINYLSSTDYDFLRTISSNKDRKTQYIEISKKLCLLIHFIVYMGNKMLWSESDGLLRYIMKILLFGDVFEKLEVADIKRELIPSKDEEATMKNWIAVHGNPSDSQLFESRDFAYWNRLKNNLPQTISTTSMISVPQRMGSFATLPSIQPSRTSMTIPSIQPSIVIPSFSLAQINESKRMEIISSLRQKRIERNFNSNRGLYLSVTGKRSEGVFMLSIRDAFISATIKRVLTASIADDTKTWNLSNLNISEIENKFNTTPFTGIEVTLEVSSFKSLYFIVMYMMHFHGDDSHASLGSWEDNFLRDIESDKMMDSVFNDVKYLAINSLVNLITEYKQKTA